MDTENLLKHWDLTGPRTRVGKEHPDWTDARLTRAVTAYRQFLYLRATYPGTRLVPHVDVDEIWHAHILHTRDYAALCEAVFRAFFHHDPSPGGEPTERDQTDYSHTRALIRHHFGDDKDPATWLKPE